MKQKSKVFTHFCNFQAFVENLFNCKIKMFQSDEGLEFDNSLMKTHFLKYDIYFRKSALIHNSKMGLLNVKTDIFWK